MSYSYAELNAILQKFETSITAAEVHGLACGIICANKNDGEQHWLKIILGHKKRWPAKSRQILQTLFVESDHQLREFSFEFTLLLPDDDTNINQRTECLGLWCQGFLTGLSHEDIPLSQHARNESTETLNAETLNDIIEISQVSFGDIPETDEEEMAYLELVEYVRLAVLSICNDLEGNADLKRSHS